MHDWFQSWLGAKRADWKDRRVAFGDLLFPRLLVDNKRVSGVCVCVSNFD